MTPAGIEPATFRLCYRGSHITFYVYGLIMSNIEVCDVEASDDSVTNIGRSV